MPNEEMLLFQTDDIPSVDTVDGGAARVAQNEHDSSDLGDGTQTPIPSTTSSMNESFDTTSSNMSTPIIDSPAELSDEGYKASSENDFIINDSIKINPCLTDLSAAVLTRQYSGYRILWALFIDYQSIDKN